MAYAGRNDRDLKRFGQRLQKVRGEKGLSQQEAAILIGMDQGYYNRIECGRHNIGYKNIVRIAKGLGISMERLFKGL